MGIAWFIKDYEFSLRILLLIGLHAIGILYLWKLHPKIFKSLPTGGKAVFLGLIGFGFGQIYNRQLIKGILFSSLLPISLLLDKAGVLDPDTTGYLSLIVIFLIPLVDAGIGASFARKRLLKNAQELELLRKVAKVLRYQLDDHEITVDTNILMHEAALLLYLIQKESIELHISMTVFNELDGLRKTTII